MRKKEYACMQRHSLVNIFQTRNLTHTGERELYTGLTDLDMKGFMVSWKKKKVDLMKC